MSQDKDGVPIHKPFNFRVSGSWFRLLELLVCVTFFGSKNRCQKNPEFGSGSGSNPGRIRIVYVLDMSPVLGLVCSGSGSRDFFEFLWRNE